MFRRLLYGKNIVLWALVTPVCLVVALVNGIFSHNLLATLYSVIWIGVVPFGVLGLSGIVGIGFPTIRYQYATGGRIASRGVECCGAGWLWS